MRFRRQYLALFLLSSFISSGCFQQIAIRSVAGILDEHGFTTLNEESDLDLAEKSLASNLKLIEIFAKGDPDNKDLQLLLTMGYASYALGFVEDEDVARARMLYLRGKEYGLQILKNNKRFARAMDGDFDSFRDALGSFCKDDVPAIFWTAASWASYIGLSLDDPEALVGLAKAEALMEHVIANDPSYYYGGAHLLLGTLYGSRPQILGGNPDKAKRHFEESLKINGGKFLMSFVYYARSYAVQTQDRALFEELLEKVGKTSLDVLPEARLPNAIAKKKSQLLLAQKDELF